MPIVIAKFGAPEDITAPGFDGKSIRFPYAFIDERFVGTPRQTTETRNGRITVEISGTLQAIWGLSQQNLVKVLFEIAKEHLAKSLRNSERIEQDTKITVNTYTHPGPCPFDPQFIAEPSGSTVQFEVTRPIGFIWNA